MAVTRKSENNRIRIERSILTRTNEHGETEFGAPVEISSKADLEMFRNAGEEEPEYWVIRFHGTDYIPVYLHWTTNRPLAEYLWSTVNRRHWEKIRNERCLIPGKQKEWIICPTCNSCKNCPFGKIEEEKKHMFVSWEATVNPEMLASPEGSAEDQAIRRIVIQDTIREMKEKDPRIWTAFAGLCIRKKPAAAIAKKLGCSVARVYQLAKEGKRMLREALEEE